MRPIEALSVPHSLETEKFYKLEVKATEAVISSARELQCIAGVTYDDAVAETLRMLAESFDRKLVLCRRIRHDARDD